MERNISEGNDEKNNCHLHPNVGITNIAVRISTLVPIDQKHCIKITSVNASESSIRTMPIVINWLEIGQLKCYDGTLYLLLLHRNKLSLALSQF